jgi:ribosome-associated protein YbcJ (S4-like RNA binding protein)
VSTSEPTEVPIRDASIRLGQLLKLAGVVEDGAMARMVIENGEVTVDGDLVLRRGTQVRPGQLVTYAGETIRVTAGG